MSENKGRNRRHLREKQRSALEKLLGEAVLHLEDKEVGILYQLADELGSDINKLERIEVFLDKREEQKRRHLEFEEIKEALRKAGAERDSDPLSGGMARVESAPPSGNDKSSGKARARTSDGQPMEPMAFSIDEEYEESLPVAPPPGKRPAAEKTRPRPPAEPETPPAPKPAAHKQEPPAAPEKSPETPSVKPPETPPDTTPDTPSDTPESGADSAPERSAEEQDDSAEQSLLGRKEDAVKVVEKYIRCWNAKAFGAEYDCFEPNRMGIDKETYMDRRMATWLVPNREDLHVSQELGNILKVQVTGSKARVLCTRIWNDHGKRKVHLDLYELRVCDGDWRIHNVETGIATDDLLVKHLAKV